MMALRSLVIPILLMAALQPAAGQTGTKQLSVDAIFGSTEFRMKSLTSFRWADNGRKFSFLWADSADQQKSVYLYDIAEGTQERIMDGSIAAYDGEFLIRSHEWSADGDYILVTESVPARRLKTGGNFGVYDVGNDTLTMLTDTDEKQALIRFSPDGSQIGFVRSNNLHVVDHRTGIETQLTFDGSENVINGEFDWVYEEEFSVIDAWEWSPDGKRISFWRIDQTNVPTFPLVRYPPEHQHAEVELMRYPKPGDPIPVVKIGVVEVETGNTVWMQTGPAGDVYIPRIHWTADPQTLAIQRLNRGQDSLQIFLANVADGSSRLILTETDSSWLDAEDGYLRFLERSDYFVWTSFRDGYNHIYLYRLDGTLDRQVTRGDWGVTSVQGIDESRGIVYFSSTYESPLERQCYQIGLDGLRMRKLTEEPGWHDVEISPNNLVYLDKHSSWSSPPSISLRSNTGELIADLVVNDPNLMGHYRLGDHRFMTISLGDTLDLNAWMITPPDFDQEQQYPVLLYVYGGPGSQRVKNEWGGLRHLWHQFLAQNGYIVVCVDSRGTGGRGKEFMQVVDLRFGLPQVEDFVGVSKYLKSLPYIDSTRVGIWGWSGGGFMACLAMTIGAGNFSTGMAVAPVTDWRFYDAIYTERYMHSPQSNPEGYRLTSALEHADSLEGNLLILHGTMDDNVHWQNSIAFIDRLVAGNKQVTTMFYPDSKHQLNEGDHLVHVYTLLTRYIMDNL